MIGDTEKYERDYQASNEISSSDLQETAASSMSFGDLFRTLRKHQWLILICALVGLIISGVYVSVATPIYEATAMLRIDPSRAGSLGLSDLLSGSGSTSDPLKTEAVILKSDSVAIAALNSLSDDQFREYTGGSKTELAFPSSLGTAAQQQEKLNGDAPVLTQRQENLVLGLVSALSVKPMEDTQILSITLRDKNPEIAATLTNHLIAAYLRNAFDSRYGSVAQVQAWLSEQLSALKERASQSQRRLAEFQQKNNIIGTDNNNNTVLDRLRALNERLGAAQADRIVREAQLRAAQTGDVATLATLYPSIGLSALQSQQASLYARYAELSAKFGVNYPPLAEVIAQRKSVDNQIQKLVDTTRNRLRQEYTVSKATEDLLQHQFDQQTQNVYALNSKQADYAVLQAEGSASRDLYDRLQYQLQQAGVTAGLSAVNTMVVTSARTPHRPVEPKKTLLLSFGLILGLIAGAAFAFLIDATGNKLQTVSQVEASLGLPILTTIPHENSLQKFAPAGGRNLPIAFSLPLSKFAEAFRALRNSILLTSIDRPHKVILITSTLGGEGKSTLSSNYAVILAQTGSRVLAIDVDLRRPRLHQTFSLPNTTGLSDLLLDETGNAPNFYHPIPEMDNLTVLTAGKSVTFPSEALGSEKFKRLINSWRSEYDFILLDSAPLMVVSDSMPIAKFADAVILLIRFDSTPIKAAQRARDLLSRVKAHVAGVVINDVPPNGVDYGSYYGYGYYSDDKPTKSKP